MAYLIVSCEQTNKQKERSESVHVFQDGVDVIDTEKTILRTEIYSQASRDSLKIVVNELNAKGSEQRNTALFKEALSTHFQALQLAEEIGDSTGTVQALNNIGTDLRRTASNTEAMEYHLRALELVGDKPNLRKSKAIAMNGLGNIFLSLEKPLDAINYFKQSLDIEKALKSHLGQAINYANLGAAMHQQKNYNLALDYYLISLEHNIFIGSQIGMAICKNAIGEINLGLGKTVKGLSLMKESVDILKNSQDAFHKMEMQISLCEAFIDLGLYSEARKTLDDILQYASQIHSYEHQNIAYQLLTDWHKKQGFYQNALASKETAIAYRDSLLQQNNEVRILEMENRYKNKEALQQITFLVQENKLVEKTKNNQQKFFILITILLASLLASILYITRKRRQLNKELYKINEMKSRFFSNVSHEFRTPITLIKGPLEKMMESKISPEIQSDAKMMYRNSQKLLSLVDQILNISKIEAGKFEIMASKGILSNALKYIIQSFEFQSIEKSIKYNIAVENSGTCWFDKEIIEIIVTNLLSNAFKYCPENGYINVSGFAANKQYVLRISNNAQLEKNQDVNKFFERFYMGSKNLNGTGIGLSLVKELCNLYHANIKAEKINNDVVFTVVFPTNKDNFAKFSTEHQNLIEPKTEETIVTTSEESVSVTDENILLVVEDNQDMRSYIKSVFEKDYHVLLAANGEEGILMAENHIPDVIVSDVMMPKVNGIELCNMLKNNNLTNHIPIILLTAVTEEETLLEGLENKADDYITKPFGTKMLKSKVANLIDIRKTLREKYQEEMIIKPLNMVIQNQSRRFTDVLKNVLENHITQPDFSVDKFCEVAAMSRTQLHRKLTATTGMSTTEFIRVHRLKIASELLENPEVSISEACYSSGFNNTSYFSKQFKKTFGVSPKEYRKKFDLN
jgi:signal transduction histidine kinase/DNA-binding response OmpR family regulator